MASIDAIADLIRPDGVLTDAGRALNRPSQEWVRACHAEVMAIMPTDSVSGISVPQPNRFSETETESPTQPTWMERVMDETENRVEWLLSGMLPMGGMAMISAAPKVGKSTFARCLALAVARGMAFLGRETNKGTVLYLSLEDWPPQIREHLAPVGASADDPIGFYFPPDLPGKTGARLNFLEAAIGEYDPALVVIDPLFKFIGVSDASAYAEVSSAMDPLMQIARRTGVHILLTHHNKKGGGRDGEEVLGSTALFGGVDSLVSLRRDGDSRTFYTEQRLGGNVPPTVLHLDPVGWVDAGGIRSEVKAREIDEQMLAVIGEAGVPLEANDIIETTSRTKKAVLDSLRRLTKSGALKQTGKGRRNDPYQYSVSEFL